MDSFNGSVAEFLAQLRSLTLTQYDATKEAAKERVRKLIKDKPTRKALRREAGQLFTPLDILALVVFVAALVVSSLHILTRMGRLANETYHPASPIVSFLEGYGVSISREAYVVGHQLGFILLAEASMLLFMVTWRMSVANEHRDIRLWRFGISRKLLSPYLLLALVAMIFVLVSNLESGLSLLEAIMPPVFTIGLGLHIEHIIVEGLRREEELQKRYLEALAVYEAASEDVTTHPKYRDLWLREIWEKLVRMRGNEEFADVNARYKLAAVRREQARDEWTTAAVADEEHVTTVATALRLPPKVVAELSDDQSVTLEHLANLVADLPAEIDEEEARIETPAGWVDLELMQWSDAGQNGRVYGPYKSRTALVVAMRSVYRTNMKRA